MYRELLMNIHTLSVNWRLIFISVVIN